MAKTYVPFIMRVVTRLSCHTSLGKRLRVELFRPETEAYVQQKWKHWGKARTRQDGTKLYTHPADVHRGALKWVLRKARKHKGEARSKAQRRQRSGLSESKIRQPTSAVLHFLLTQIPSKRTHFKQKVIKGATIRKTLLVLLRIFDLSIFKQSARYDSSAWFEYENFGAIIRYEDRILRIFAQP